MDRDEVTELGIRAQFGRKDPVEGRRGVVVTSHPLAVRAGTDVLKEGGNACDAALAAAATQLVVEPHMTAVTGGLSMLYRDGVSGAASYLNGNVAAPLARLEHVGGADLTTGRAVPVPGWWPAFRAAHARFGTTARHRVLDPAVQLAHDGTISSHIDHWPMILGHEIAGVVSDVGEGVAGQNAPEQVRRAAGGPGHRWRPAEREGNARGTSRSGPPRAMYVDGAPVPRFTVHLTGSGRLAGGWMSVP